MENFLGSIGKFLAGHFKGGVLWIYVAAAGVFIAGYGYINYLEARLDKEKVKLEACIAAKESTQETVKSQSRQVQRKEAAREELNDVQEKINSSPNPIDYTYDWLLEYRSEDQAGNSDD